MAVGDTLGDVVVVGELPAMTLKEAAMVRSAVTGMPSPSVVGTRLISSIMSSVRGLV